MVFAKEGDDLERSGGVHEFSVRTGEARGAAAGRERAVKPGAAGGQEEAMEGDLARELQLAFAPIHKRAFAVAVGTASSLLVVAVTLFHLLLDRGDLSSIGLLGQFFYGYSVSWAGVVIGGFWGFVTGFVAGWFAAFCRNLVIAISVFITRTRAELAQTRDFLDHI